ncbi:hypothetical protein [Pseudonocardia pini]|uniref:hypothetical protein n=1 Tax=Pseudonocardia pini TaxID=2758030 RepID=UPI0015F083A7|nr:hypothetical protein [Pseudonocardia pini]
MGSHAPRKATLAKIGFAALAAPAAMLAVAGTASAADLAPVGAYLDENVTYGTPPLEPVGAYVDEAVAATDKQVFDVVGVLTGQFES